VSILLSTDGGLTFPTILATATPNDGAQTVLLPAGLSTTTARIKVQPTDNIFFAISPQDFTISTVLGSSTPSAPLAGLEIFPNPSTGVFHLNVNNQQVGPITVHVMDALGRTILQETVSKAAAPLQHRFDLRHASQGVYHLRLTTPYGTSVTRLLKE
jgi:hypothetical protein